MAAAARIALTLILAGQAGAQMYAFDPKHPPANATANVYFGSTKDRSGHFLSGVTARLEIDQVTYVMVTDEAGRFKIGVPKEVLPSMVKFSCFKPGYIQIQATKRLPPDKAASPIQADCVLERRHVAAAYADIGTGFDFPADETRLAAMRASGDLAAQRRHLWQLLAGLTAPAPGGALPTFMTWYGAGEVYGAQSTLFHFNRPRGLNDAFSLPPPKTHSAGQRGAPPRITRAHYDFAAFQHIRANPLYAARTAMAMPTFPRRAAVVKTLWWPVPANGVVALPVWDPESNPPAAGGNDYPSWARVVGVSAQQAEPLAGDAVDVEFMGKSFHAASRVGLNAFYHIVLDQGTAALLMADPMARDAALMLLGRPLHANDALALVALHVATRETADWVWGTFWWHDAPDRGPYASLRPANLASPWRNYLMSVSFDTDLPTERDGSPHLAYNPWFEARLVDTGSGSGVVSNCMTCHRRASSAVIAPFAVTRGATQSLAIPPGSPAPVLTSSLWSIPLEAQ